MKFADLRRTGASLLAAALAVSLFAVPAKADTTSTTTVTTSTSVRPMTFTRISYPATVTSISSDSVVLDVNGNPVTLPSSFATYSLNGQPVAVTSLQTGSKVMVMYPEFTGSVSSLNGNMVLLTNADGSTVMVPATYLTPALRNDMVYVRLSNGRYVIAPLSTAINLQNRHGATIVSVLPDGTTATLYATGDDVMSPRVRNINWSEGVRIQKDPSKLIQDSSINGDSNF